MIKRPTNNQRLGFTLIELLIVIGVIGVLAGSILTIIKPFEQFAKARDAERKQTLRELANALERYMIKNRIYPITFGAYFSSEPGDASPNGPSCPPLPCGDWIPGLLASNEITRLPRDPKGGPSPSCPGRKRAYLYISDINGSCYKLISHCAPEASGVLNDPTDPFFDLPHADISWMVCQPPGSVCCGF